MKKTAAALLAAFLLSSCSLADEQPMSSEFTEDEPTETQSYIFTGLPDIPSPGYDTETEPVTDIAGTEPASAEEEQTSEAPPVSTALTTPQNPELPPDGVHCIETPYISQNGSPAGCELVCTSMLLAYYGFNISSDELLSEGYIDMVPVDTYTDPERGNVMFSGDPDQAFIGDPHTSYGYGCFSGAIRSCLRKYLEHELYDAVDISGLSLKDLCMEYIDFGEPVIIWASVGMEPLYTNEANTWEIQGTDKTVEWRSNEHCFLLVGYNEESYCFHDPLNGAYTLYPRDVSEARYREMGSQAVTIHPW